MLDRIKQFVSENKWAQFLLVAIISAIIAVLFYPTKHIEETERKKYQQELEIVRQQKYTEQKALQETINKTNQELVENKIDYERKISKLTYEVKDLKSKQKTSYFKIVRPDGTIEIKKFSESETEDSTKIISQVQEEFKAKIQLIEKKWENIHKDRFTAIQKEFKQKEQEYKKEIAELEKVKIVDINKKFFGLEMGITLDNRYYTHVTYDVFGPLFLGLHAQLGAQNTGGVGIGLRF